MSDVDLVVIHNPTSGRSDSLADVREVLEARGARARYVATTAGDPGAGHARRAVEEGVSRVLVAGGDGTMRSCAEGLMGTGVAMGLIPLGTGNVLARDLGIPTEIGGAVETALNGEIRRVDVGLANGEAFVGISGLGLAAWMIRDADADLKAAIGPGAYLTSALRHLWREPFRVRLTLGTGERVDRSATLVLVATAGEAPGGLRPFPQAEPGDGLLRALIVEGRGLLNSVRALVAVLQGRRHELVQRHAARRVVVETHRPVGYELNGEYRQKTTRIEYSVRPGALNVLVPHRDAAP